MLNILIKEAQETLSVTPDATLHYVQLRDTLLDGVNGIVASHPEFNSLIGNNSMSMVHNNHSNHIDFMATVFQYNSFEILVKTIPWVYRTYQAHGFSFDYFPVQLNAWKSLVTKNLDTKESEQINAVYDWMLKNHENMIELSAMTTDEEDPYPELVDERRKFANYLLEANYHKCMEMAEMLLVSENGLEALYMGLIQPVMYEIGNLWEQDEINTAEEHLATSIVGRVIAGLYSKLPVVTSYKGKVIVTAAPNEFHELGGRMLADMLDASGWDVIFLGANTPIDELVELIRKTNPHFLAISLTMQFSISKVAKIISILKNSPDLSDIKILVGGSAFNADQNLWKQIGADAWAPDPQSAIKQVLEW